MATKSPITLLGLLCVGCSVLPFEPVTSKVLEEMDGFVDPSRMGIVGHSAGSITALRTFVSDERFRTAVAQTPLADTITWVDLPRPPAQRRRPVMLQVGGRDNTTPPAMQADLLWGTLQGPRHQVVLRDAGHFTFSDMCTLDPETIRELTMSGIGNALDGCEATNTPPELAIPIIRTFTIGLLNAELRDSPASLDWIADFESVYGDAVAYAFDPGA